MGGIEKKESKLLFKNNQPFKQTLFSGFFLFFFDTYCCTSKHGMDDLECMSLNLRLLLTFYDEAG